MRTAIVLFLLLCALVQASSNDVFITPSGRTLSRNELINRIPSKIRSEAHRYVYDISEDNVLHGPDGFRLDLASLERVKPVSLSPWLPFYVDVDKKSIGKPKTYIHTDKEHHAVFHGESKTTDWTLQSQHYSASPGRRQVSDRVSKRNRRRA